MNIFWDIHQQHQINSVSASTDRVAGQSERMSVELRDMRRELNRVTIACQALWELVRENTDITEAMMAERMQDVDLRDGVADGKMGPQIIACASCGAKTNTRRGHCVMCGETVQGDHLLGG